MLGLYALKPWYAERLSGVRRLLIAKRVTPNTITAASMVCGAGAGLAFLLLRPGVLAGVVVAALLAARLACSNLDGAVARESDRSTKCGGVVNEIGDRVGEIATIAGLVLLAPFSLVLGAAFAASTPSWVSLAGRSAGAPRLQGGPVGKTERCVILVALAFTGWSVPLLAVLATGSLATAAYRLLKLHRILAPS
jgi:CDP-diacylglycerol---glycerol-3-phosphate 3-phosphatidyltransferase